MGYKRSIKETTKEAKVSRVTEKLLKKIKIPGSCSPTSVVEEILVKL